MRLSVASLSAPRGGPETRHFGGGARLRQNPVMVRWRVGSTAALLAAGSHPAVALLHDTVYAYFLVKRASSIPSTFSIDSDAQNPEQKAPGRRCQAHLHVHVHLHLHQYLVGQTPEPDHHRPLAGLWLFTSQRARS